VIPKVTKAEALTPRTWRVWFSDGAAMLVTAPTEADAKTKAQKAIADNLRRIEATA
jgi:hypothetical protein